jgi:galactokinase
MLKNNSFKDKKSSAVEKGICLNDLYGNDKKVVDYQKNRYNKLYKNFQKIFGEFPVKYFSSPGRTEISGNHTDHNKGIVIAASINLDSVACVTESSSKVEIYSDGFDKPFMVGLDELEPVEEEVETTSALIRGIAASLSEKGYKIGGFKACITSDVLIGSGLSSSASVEVLIGTIFNHLYNNGNIPVEEIAKIGQLAENKFFRKPCGLMDQIACAVGGIVSIDFKNKDNPEINKIEFDFLKHGYSLLVVHTGGSHMNLTDDYAAIPNEMHEVAKILGKETCREVDYNYFITNISRIRDKVSDRAILRAYHFFRENERVREQVEALKKDDFTKFLQLVNDSGDSSFKWLQNIYSSNNVSYQPISLALAMTKDFISKIEQGACRVHGGGFEGTILAFLPFPRVDEFKKYISGIFGDYSILDLTIRQNGAVCIVEV